MIGFWAVDSRGVAAAWYSDLLPALPRMRLLGHGASVVRASDGAVMAVCMQSTSTYLDLQRRKAERRNIKIRFGEEGARRYWEAAGKAAKYLREVEHTFKMRRSNVGEKNDPVPELEEFMGIGPSESVSVPDLDGCNGHAECVGSEVNVGWKASDRQYEFDWTNTPRAFSGGGMQYNPVERL